MLGNFAELNAQTVAIESAIMLADDMAEARELDTMHEVQALDLSGDWTPNPELWDETRLRSCWDRSAALHEFILNNRYEKANPVHTHR